MDEPEKAPPSPQPLPRLPLALQGADYYLELANRVERHIKVHVIGQEAKREIEYAVTILRQLGEAE